MQKLKMTDKDLIGTQKGPNNQNVRDLFSEDDSKAETINKQLIDSSTHEAQKDIHHYLTIHELVSSFLAEHMIPAFKEDKARNYRKMIQNFAKIEIENARHQDTLWSNVLGFHQKKASDEMVRLSIARQEDVNFNPKGGIALPKPLFDP